MLFPTEFCDHFDHDSTIPYTPGIITVLIDGNNYLGKSKLWILIQPTVLASGIQNGVTAIIYLLSPQQLELSFLRRASSFSSRFKGPRKV
jgi:hypothetical protein